MLPASVYFQCIYCATKWLLLWFRVKLEAPFEPGKPMRGHITYPGYEHIVFNAQVVALEPETYFSFTWHPYAIDPKQDYSHEPSTAATKRSE